MRRSPERHATKHLALRRVLLTDAAILKELTPKEIGGESHARSNSSLTLTGNPLWEFLSDGSPQSAPASTDYTA
jgi:hypothetical protein